MRRRPDKPGLSYRDAGVDIDAQHEALRRIGALVRSTRTPGVLADIGSFGGLFAPTELTAFRDPVLVSSCDGVGTKLRVAFLTGIHNTVGRDLVNHCVNDILVEGARPLFFMDYLATGRLDPSVVVAVVGGIVAGCREAGCALLGGETAEMPGFYRDGEYDLAGFIVGVVERERIVDGRKIRAGDVVVGLAARGLHTNGYSLARKVVFEVAGLGVGDRIEELGMTAGEALLVEHPSYLRAVEGILHCDWLHGLAHITGGGITGNLPRILPAGTAARVEQGAWPLLPIFEYIQRVGGVAPDEMYRTFNMGIGMIVVVAPDGLSGLERQLATVGQAHYRIGQVIEGDRTVHYA
jgi:phosphoribosylformylglycinamidine cyclo-ligase